MRPTTTPSASTSSSSSFQSPDGRLAEARLRINCSMLRLDQFRLDHAPSLFQGSHLSFRGGDDLLRERCEQRLKSLVSVDRKHPLVLTIVLEHRIGP